MEVAVTAGVVTGAIKTLLPKLASLLHNKYKLPSGVRRQITSLRHEMSSMSALLVTLATWEELGELEKDWRDKVRELSYDIEDCVDIFTNELDSDGPKRGRWLRRRFKKLKARYKIAHRIEELKAQALYVDPARLVGIDAPKEKLIDLLLRKDAAGTQQLKVVAIAGFGGMGKTTLANQVYTKIKGQFACTAFVSVSRNAIVAKVLSDILLGIRGWLSHGSQTIDGIREHLQDKRYLIVIDDIWTMESWNAIKGCFFENGLGSRVITTTRFEDIARECCSSLHGHFYKIKPLNGLDSRRLFDRRVFRSGDACPEKLKNIRDEILNKCEGVPLVILSVASILASHEEDSNEICWEKIHKHLGFHLEGHPALGWIRHVLNLGYNDLCLDLKTCLLYFSIFPEDTEIMKNDLVKIWLAEGFVTEKHGYGQHEIAESYLSELINRNMIQIAKFDECGHVLSCRVHDIMLDFIILKSTEENFVTIMNDLRRSTRGCLEVRRLSLQVKNSECNHLLEKMSLTQARSFTFWGPAECIPGVAMFQLLRVLHISGNGEFDLSCICNLFQLKYLRVVGIWCTEWPKQLWKLQHLQTLEISRVSSENNLEISRRNFYIDVVELPLSLWHLIIPSHSKLIGDIGWMRSLISVDPLAIHYLEGMERMRGLGNLTHLRELVLQVSVTVWFIDGRGRDPVRRGHLDVPYLEGVAICEPLLSSLGRLGSLQSLIIRWGLPADVLHCWSPPPCHLRRFHVRDCPFSSVPGWITQLANLRSLEIQVASMTRDGIQILAQLDSLVNLRLQVTKHNPREGGVIIPGGVAFPKLKALFFRCKAICLMFEAGAMPMLENLTVECHSKAARLAVGDVLEGIEHLGSLNRCNVHIYKREHFVPTLRGGCSPTVRQESYSRYDDGDVQTLVDAVRQAINKHPGCLEVTVIYM
ncbi:unnamed protein product [Alopecurus aequalis]